MDIDISKDAWVSLIILSSIALLTMYGETMLLPAIPELVKDFKIAYNTSSWILTAYLITGAVMTPIAGKLSDIYGGKNTGNNYGRLCYWNFTRGNIYKYNIHNNCKNNYGNRFSNVSGSFWDYPGKISGKKTCNRTGNIYCRLFRWCCSRSWIGGNNC